MSENGKRHSVAVPCGHHVNERGEHYAYFEDGEGRWAASGHSYRSAAEARQNLRAEIVRDVLGHAEHERNYRRAMIFVREPDGGTAVFLVEFRHSWGYSIARPGQSYLSGGCSMPGEFEDALKAAREHAAQMGDVIGECGT